MLYRNCQSSGRIVAHRKMRRLAAQFSLGGCSTVGPEPSGDGGDDGGDRPPSPKPPKSPPMPRSPDRPPSRPKTAEPPYKTPPSSLTGRSALWERDRSQHSEAAPKPVTPKKKAPPPSPHAFPYGRTTSGTGSPRAWQRVVGFKGSFKRQCFWRTTPIRKASATLTSLG